MITTIDHIQISIPAGKVADALSFYVDALGFVRVKKPAELPQDGAWLEQGAVKLHLGEEADFATDSRAHPAFAVTDIEAILARCAAGGYRVRRDEGPTGYSRASAFDKFGNRVELMQKL